MAVPHWFPHPLEAATQSTLFPSDTTYAPSVTLALSPLLSAPLQYTDVYIDDFLAAAQPPVSPQLMRCLLHCIDAVFTDAPNSP